MTGLGRVRRGWFEIADGRNQILPAEGIQCGTSLPPALLVSNRIGGIDIVSSTYRTRSSTHWDTQPACPQVRATPEPRMVISSESRDSSGNSSRCSPAPQGHAPEGRLRVDQVQAKPADPGSCRLGRVCGRRRSVRFWVLQGRRGQQRTKVGTSSLLGVVSLWRES
jgi:hypothetical protein